MSDAEPLEDAAVDVVVVGGGVAGLVAAYDAARSGERVLVLEASARAGGTVHGATLRVGPLDGITVDVGAESFATRNTAVADLARELGLAVVHPDPRGAWAYAAADTGEPGRAVPLPRTATLGIPADPFADDVLRVLGPDGAARAARDLETAPTPVSSSLAAWVTERLGPTVLDRLVAPVAGGIHSADPATLDPRAVAPALVAAYERTGSLLRAVAEVVGPTTDPAGRVSKPGATVAGIDGGLHRLVDALVRAIEEAGGAVRTGYTAAGLTHDPDAGWTVRASGGDAVRARRVVVASPRTAALTLLEPWIPSSSGAPADVPGGRGGSGGPVGSDVRLITLALDAPALDSAPRGTGVLVAPSADVRAKGLTHSSAKWPWLRAVLPDGVHVVRLSYGRAGDPLPTPAPTVDEAVSDAGRILGVPLSRAQVLDHVDTHWANALAPARPDDRQDVAAAVAAVPGLTVVGAWVAGTGLAAVVGQARATHAPLPQAHDEVVRRLR